MPFDGTDFEAERRPAPDCVLLVLTIARNRLCRPWGWWRATVPLWNWQGVCVVSALPCPDTAVWNAAIEHLATALPLPRPRTIGPAVALMMYNDAYSTRLVDVLALYDRAIDAARVGQAP